MSHPYQREQPPASFGRPRQPEPEPHQAVLLPPVVMPPVQVPVVLVVDVGALQYAAEQIAGMVADAVRRGFDEALAEQAPDGPTGAGPGFGAADVHPAQLAGL